MEFLDAIGAIHHQTNQYVWDHRDGMTPGSHDYMDSPKFIALRNNVRMLLKECGIIDISNPPMQLNRLKLIPLPELDLVTARLFYKRLRAVNNVFMIFLNLFIHGADAYTEMGLTASKYIANKQLHNLLRVNGDILPMFAENLRLMQNRTIGSSMLFQRIEELICGKSIGSTAYEGFANLFVEAKRKARATTPSVSHGLLLDVDLLPLKLGLMKHGHLPIVPAQFTFLVPEKYTWCVNPSEAAVASFNEIDHYYMMRLHSFYMAQHISDLFNCPTGWSIDPEKPVYPNLIDLPLNGIAFEALADYYHQCYLTFWTKLFYGMSLNNASPDVLVVDRMSLSEEVDGIKQQLLLMYPYQWNTLREFYYDYRMVTLMPTPNGAEIYTFHDYLMHILSTNSYSTLHIGTIRGRCRKSFVDRLEKNKDKKV